MVENQMGNAPSNPGGYNAYKKQSQQQAEDYRVTEANALLRCAALLEEAKSPDVAYMDYAEAVRHNQNLWTMFQAALVEEGNPLPEPLKDTLKGLSVYVDRRTLRALAEHKADLLNVLININKEIAAGLMESYKNSQPKTETPPADDASKAGSGDAPPLPRINTQIF